MMIRGKRREKGKCNNKVKLAINWGMGGEFRFSFVCLWIRQGLVDRVVCDMHNHRRVIEAHRRQKGTAGGAFQFFWGRA